MLTFPFDYRNGVELMDGYTRYPVLKQYNQQNVDAYLGSVGHV